MIERKIRYDGTVVEVEVTLLQHRASRIDVIHYIEEAFTMSDEGYHITITLGNYTRATYWIDRPYNVYRWYDKEHRFIAAYFNIVGKTTFDGHILSFEDKIIDILVLPNGKTFILDEDELPLPLAEFENGVVAKALTIALQDALTIAFSPPDFM